MRDATAVDRSPTKLAVDESDRPNRLRKRVTLSLLLSALALLLLSGLSLLTAPSTTVSGSVVAIGGDLAADSCYPTVAYEVDGERYRVTEHDSRLCVYHWGSDATVYYDPDDPGDARLTKYGDLPGRLAGGAMGLLLVAGGVGTRKRHVSELLTWALFLAWCALLAAFAVGSQRESDLHSLEQQILSGEVGVVEVAGGMREGSTGFATLELRWSHDGLDYYTEVAQLRGRQLDEASQSGVTGYIRGDVATYLRRGSSQLRVEPTYFVDRSGITAHVAGWRVTGGLVWFFGALFLLSVRVLVVGAEPRRGTKWAWFWLMFVLSPLAAPVFFALGRPHGPAWTKGDGRRLTGGWAFVMCLLLGSALGALA